MFMYLDLYNHIIVQDAILSLITQKLILHKALFTQYGLRV